MIAKSEEFELPLFDLDAERQVIASLIAFPDKLKAVREIVQTDDFSATHGEIFSAILEAAADGAIPEVAATATKLRNKTPPAGGWVPYIAQMYGIDFVSVNVEYHAKLVRDLAKRRRAQGVVNAMQHALNDRVSKPIEAVNEVKLIWGEGSIVDLLDDNEPMPIVGEAAKLIRARIDGTAPPEAVISTTLVDLDALMCGGPHKGSLTVIAAKSGVGKTALGMQIARCAAGQGTVLYVSAEMSRSELLGRMVASESQVSHSWIQSGALTPDSRRRAHEALTRLEKLPVRVPDRRSATVEEVGAWARRCRDAEGLALLVVDYIGILRVSQGREKDTREQQVGHIAKELKCIAADLNIPVIAMSQLNDDGQVRDSRAVEHHCDNLLVIERDDSVAVANNKLQKTAIHLRKGRSTGRGSVEVVWQPQYVRFVNAEGS